MIRTIATLAATAALILAPVAAQADEPAVEPTASVATAEPTEPVAEMEHVATVRRSPKSWTLSAPATEKPRVKAPRLGPPSDGRPRIPRPKQPAPHAPAPAAEAAPVLPTLTTSANQTLA